MSTIFFNLHNFDFWAWLPHAWVFLFQSENDFSRYNVRPNGKADTLTLHGACPVLYGTKWGQHLSSSLSFDQTATNFICLFSCQQVDPGGRPDLEEALPPLKRLAAVINHPVINRDLLRIHNAQFLQKFSMGGGGGGLKFYIFASLRWGLICLQTISANTGYTHTNRVPANKFNKIMTSLKFIFNISLCKLHGTYYMVYVWLFADLCVVTSQYLVYGSRVYCH